MMSSNKRCPKCDQCMSDGGTCWHEWNRFEYTHEFFHCESCGQWYEETSIDIPCGPYEQTMEPVSKEMMENRFDQFRHKGADEK